MILSIIAAVANNNVIGSNNRLVWHIPADLKHFKKTTMGHTLIMGRRTFESLGKPLKGRTTIVVTRKSDYDAGGCTVAGSVKEAIRMVRNEKEVFIAGGADIYNQTIDLYQTRRMYITRIYANFEGDAFFPEIDPGKWELTDIQEHQPDEKNIYPYAFMEYRKISSRRKR